MARHIAQTFVELVKDDWTGETEKSLFSSELKTRLAFGPQVDVCLSGPGGRRIWIELEISRADPVANQAKFLIAHQAGEVDSSDVFISMISSHVQRGRRNLCGVFMRQMRQLGIPAFQLSLLPDLAPSEVKKLNHMTPEKLHEIGLPIRRELNRVFAVAQPHQGESRTIHFVGDVVDVVANLWSWNDAMDSGAASRWARRSIRYLVYDPASNLFAPSKYCAFLPVELSPSMTTDIYQTLDDATSRFDGTQARRHLTDKLAFRQTTPVGPVREHLDRWLATRTERVSLHADPQILMPPEWYANA